MYSFGPAARARYIQKEFERLKIRCPELRLGLVTTAGTIDWDDDILEELVEQWNHDPDRRGGLFMYPPIFPDPTIVVVSTWFCELGIFFHEREHWRQWRNDRFDYAYAALKDKVDAELRCEEYALKRLLRIGKMGTHVSDYPEALNVFVNSISKPFVSCSQPDEALCEARKILMANSPVWKKAMKALGRS